jgi:hypothetical protein
MSSEPARWRRFLYQLAPPARAVAWILVAALLAVAGAGLVAKLWHPAGSPARAELTWVGDSELTSALLASEAQILDVANEVDRLADEARVALASATASDPGLLQASLSRGTVQVQSIDAAVLSLREALRSLPGAEPDAALHYRNELVLRRAALLAAVDAAADLSGHWTAVRARSSDVAGMLGLIAAHDERVLAAAEDGRAASYPSAISKLDEARAILKSIEELRARLVSGSDPTVLDEWVDRNRTYDDALSALYEALRKSRGKTTAAVRAAAEEERNARSRLPADRRAIVVIVAEIARGGLNQAVLAIEETRGRIDAALADAAAAADAAEVP